MTKTSDEQMSASVVVSLIGWRSITRLSLVGQRLCRCRRRSHPFATRTQRFSRVVRHGSRMRHLLAGVVTAGVVGCAGAAPMQPPQPKAEPTGVLHGIPGETMLYQVQLRGLPVARVEVAAGSLGLIDGHRAVIVHSHGHSDGLLSIVTDLTYDLETRLDLDTGRPLDDIEEIRI